VRIPVGRLVRKASGGPGALQKGLAECEREAFSGYLEVRRRRGPGAHERGAVVFREGAPILADFEGDEALEGRPALSPLIRASESRDAVLEFRSFAYASSSVSVDHLARFFPGAAVAPADLEPRALLRLPRLLRLRSEASATVEAPSRCW